MTKDDPSLEELMILSQKGDKQSYRKLLLQIEKIARGYLYKRVNTREDLEDIIQETLCSIHKAKHTYDGKRPLKPWILAITRYRFNDYLRKHYKKADFKEIEFGKMEESISENVTFNSDDSELLYEAMNSLPEKQKEIVYMMKIEGYSVKEVAAKYSMTESAVKVAAHRAYKKLAKLLKDDVL